MGELLAETERNPGTRPNTEDGGHMMLPPSDKPTLAELGLTKRESSQAQKLAELPEEKFLTVCGMGSKPRLRR
jgi:hypothetical protein